MTRSKVHLAASAVAIAGLAFVLARIVGAHTEPVALGDLAQTYIRLSRDDLAIPNVITGILLVYRGFDTLGEVAVLYMVAASLGPLLQPIGERPDGIAALPPVPAGEIVETGQHLLLPIIATFGGYVVLNGHLSAGGGFQGGAIIASGIGLYLLSRPTASVNVSVLSVLESTAGVLFVFVGVLGIVLAGGFLDPSFLPAGQFGHFISGGAIPLVSLLLGVKVANELGVVLARFRA